MLALDQEDEMFRLRFPVASQVELPAMVCRRTAVVAVEIVAGVLVNTRGPEGPHGGSRIAKRDTTQVDFCD